MVAATPPIAITTGQTPRSAICPNVIRAPSRAMPSRSRVRALNVTPSAHRSSEAAGLRAMPTSSAISIAGAL